MLESSSNAPDGISAHRWCVTVMDIPMNVSKNLSVLIAELFGKFGDIVAVETDGSDGTSTCVVCFAQASGLRQCLERIVQHEVVGERSDGGPTSRRRGYLFVGYFRLLVDGCMPHRDECSDLMLSPPPAADRAPVETHSSGGDDDSDDDSDDVKSNVSAGGGNGVGCKAAVERPASSTNCMMLLKFIELIRHRHDARGFVLTPFAVYQILRDTCLPMRIVMCRKPQEPSAPAPTSTAHRVLVQVDKPASVAAVLAAFNGSVVELVDAQPPTSVSTARPAPPLAQRYRVFASEASEFYADGSRRREDNELHVVKNTDGALSITQQSIIKMGGIFERRWKHSNTCGADADLAVESSDLQPSSGAAASREGDGVPPERLSQAAEFSEENRRLPDSDQRHSGENWRESHCKSLGHAAAESVGGPRHDVFVGRSRAADTCRQPWRTSRTAEATMLSHVSHRLHSNDGPHAVWGRQPAAQGWVPAAESRSRTETRSLDTFYPQRQFVQQDASLHRGSTSCHSEAAQGGGDAWSWECVYSAEYQREYYVGTHRVSGEQRTTWEQPSQLLMHRKQ